MKCNITDPAYILARPLTFPVGRKRILFDSALPSFKTPTRISRLEDSLRKLSRYRSLYPTLRHGNPSSISDPQSFFAPTAPRTFTPRTQHLSAPPFIVAAALSWLSAHDVYRNITETVPGEADPFLAAEAIRNGGIVLTGDSDLLVFSGGEREWGVVMMQDLAFTDTGVSARVFRPTHMAASLKYPLLEIAYQTSLDPHTTLSQILERLKRVEERRRQGVGKQNIPDGFIREYMLPPVGEPARTVEEPRIGELLFLAANKKPASKRKMYFPFLIEDPQRAPAWEAGSSIRGLAYSLLFGVGEGGVMEVFRRGVRITDSLVDCVDGEAKVTELAARMLSAPDSWWASVILEDICDIAQGRNQGPPTANELSASATSLLPSGLSATSEKTKQKWTWALLHTFAMTQAGWYSLLLLREVLAYLDSHGAVVAFNPENVEVLRHLQPSTSPTRPCQSSLPQA